MTNAVYFPVSAKSDVSGSAGYTEDFCYSCEVTLPGGLGSIFIDKDDLHVIQNPLDCSSSLVDAGFADPPQFQFSGVQGSIETLATDYKTIFTHS